MEQVIIATLTTFIITVIMCAKALDKDYIIKKSVVHTQKRISFEDGSIWEKREDI